MPACYTHSFEMTAWTFFRADAESGYAWFLPLADEFDSDDLFPFPFLTIEARARRFPLYEMKPHFR